MGMGWRGEEEKRKMAEEKRLKKGDWEKPLV